MMVTLGYDVVARNYMRNDGNACAQVGWRNENPNGNINTTVSQLR